MMNDLNTCREAIDQIDQEIINLFTRRMTICEQITAIKQQSDLSVYDAEREAEKIRQLTKKAPEGLQQYIPVLVQTLMDLSKSYQAHYLCSEATFDTEFNHKMKLLVINGPNLNLLGIREPEIYGHQSYGELIAFIAETAQSENLIIDCYQSNHEGDLIDRIQDARLKYDAIIINPGGYTHTSIAIMDAISGVDLPTVEVHLSDIDHRETFRQHSFISSVCLKTFSGMGFESYRQGICFLKAYLSKNL